MQIPKRSTSTTQWFTPENPTGEPGGAGLTNRGAKGRAFVPLPAGAGVELMSATGSGTIRRIWLTLSDLSPDVLRGMRLEAYWDDAAEPAVRMPLGDFFGAARGRLTAFESALVSSPEGRSLCSVFPMPFRTSARVLLVNDSGRDLQRVFYEVDATVGDDHDDDVLYLHARWRRERATVLGHPFLALPEVHGSGRLIGLQLGVVTDPAYRGLWWGEGEVRMRIDRADGLALSGTGLEDYVGTGWGMGAFAHRSQGCPIAEPGDGSVPGWWTPYRFHLDDPVWFAESIEVTVDAIGGGPTADVLAAAEHADLEPITIDVEGEGLIRLLDGSSRATVADPRYARAWTNFFRSDDYSATVWFYLDRPEGG
ncbi:MAG TPA: glycoside hydrolase family 172 protein [Lacisediminihabitans sp.]|uniref:glycoside hydrolase family 172 protein n=1 Tax=Lacisediminihabitans sp. TaxID=2787631 RepID=UPI002ED7CD55